MLETYPFVPRVVNRRLPPDGAVLEIGCGPQQYRPLIRGQYKSLDVPECHTLIERPDFLCGAEKIPTYSNQFDAVFGVASFFCIPNVLAALRECYRVLKPGGCLTIFDYKKHIGIELVANKQKYGWNHQHSWTSEELRSLLVDSGFHAKYVNDISDDVDTGWPLSPIGHIKHKIGVTLRLLPKNASWLIFEAQKFGAT